MKGLIVPDYRALRMAVHEIGIINCAKAARVTPQELRNWLNQRSVGTNKEALKISYFLSSIGLLPPITARIRELRKLIQKAPSIPDAEFIGRDRDNIMPNPRYVSPRIRKKIERDWKRCVDYTALFMASMGYSVTKGEKGDAKAQP